MLWRGGVLRIVNRSGCIEVVALRLRGMSTCITSSVGYTRHGKHDCVLRGNLTELSRTYAR